MGRPFAAYARDTALPSAIASLGGGSVRVLSPSLPVSRCCRATVRGPVLEVFGHGRAGLRPEQTDQLRAAMRQQHLCADILALDGRHAEKAEQGRRTIVCAGVVYLSQRAACAAGMAG